MTPAIVKPEEESGTKGPGSDPKGRQGQAYRGEESATAAFKSSREAEKRGIATLRKPQRSIGGFRRLETRKRKNPPRQPRE